MQALIDFDGWRKWKDFSQDKNVDGPSSSYPNAAVLPAKSQGGALAAKAFGGKIKRDKSKAGVDPGTPTHMHTPTKSRSTLTSSVPEGVDASASVITAGA